MRQYLTIIPATVAFLLTLAACSEDRSGETLRIYQDIVTFTGNTDSGAQFDFQELNDSPVITLGVNGTLRESEVKPGTRLLMTYSLPEGYVYGNNCPSVELRGLQFIYTDTITPLPSETISLPLAPIYLSTIWRSGHYINLTTSMPALKDRKYLMLADEKSLMTDTALVYLTTKVKEESPSYNSTQVCSVDIEPVWSIPGIKAMKVMVNNSNNPYRTLFVFSK